MSWAANRILYKVCTGEQGRRMDSISRMPPSPLNDEYRRLEALRPVPQLRRQARNFAQLPGHFFESFGSLLRGLLRFRDTASQDGVAFPFRLQEFLNFLRLGSSSLGFGQPPSQLFYPLLFTRELLRKFLRAGHGLFHRCHLLNELRRGLPFGI